MSSTVKSHKDKPYTAVPRLTPRPTAASAARAARNATNRNLNTPVTQRLSPARSPPSPVTSRVKTAIQRGGRSDSKTEIKVNKNREHETSQIANIVPDNQNIVFEVEEVNGNLEQAMPIDNSVNNTRNNDDNNNEVNDTEETFNNSGLPEIETPAELPNEKDDEMCTRTPVNSRPHTPIINRPTTPVLSRPQTPKPTANRPQTPRIQSRPSTPINVTQRNNTPHSRPNTPQKSTMVPRPKTPAKPIATRPVTPIASNPPRTCENENVDVRTVYFAKQKQLHRLKKELDIKQQAVLEVFDHLRNLHERMVSEGVSASGEGLSELVLLNVADWTENEINQLCRTTVDPSLTEGAVELFNTTVPIDENALADIESKAMNIPSCFADLCLQAFTARQELIDWIKEYLEKEEDANSDALDRISSYNNRGLEMCEALRDLKARAEDAVHTITLLSKRACRERATLISVGESLVREVARLRQDLESRTTVISEIHEIPTESETTKALDETRRELEEERASKATMKEKLSTTEAQLRQQRIRISKMDRQLREAEASITSLTSTVKSLEDQSRQREVQLEARARKLRESLKTGEVTSSHLAQQRDTLEAQVSDLNEQIKTMTAQHKTNIQEVNNKLNELTLTLEAERESSRREIELKNALQENLKESQFTIEELKSKINEFERNKPNPDLPTEREMDLWAELQAIKDTLRITEEEVIACKREKVRFLETLTKIAESDNKVGLQQKLAAELLSKEEIISKMQTQARDLTKNIKLNEQKLIQYEQYVRDLQAHNRAIANCQETPNGISYQDLQQEIMDLKMGLLDAVHKNEDLSEMLAQKDQQLEQQDKTSRAQARVIKVREELINMLKNKETEQSRELAALQHDLEHRMKIVDEVNKQIAAKADEIQELFATLETKQQQIHRLEKIVIALEEQQRRAQAQRTRHEEKIAALEHEIAAGGNRKDRKFIFF